MLSAAAAAAAAGAAAVLVWVVEVYLLMVVMHASSVYGTLAPMLQVLYLKCSLNSAFQYI